MRDVKISWHEDKRQGNLRKHALDFADAFRIFGDPLAVTVFDRVANQEERWHTLGALYSGSTFKIVVIVHTFPAGDDVDWTHIISMRPADARERKRYEQQISHQ